MKPSDKSTQPLESPKPSSRPRETAQQKADRLAQLMVESLNRKTSRPDPHELENKPGVNRA